MEREHRGEPAVGQVQWGDLRRTMPIGRDFGRERGRPIDRYYIERFLSEHAVDVRGRVLELGDDSYTRQFGGTAVQYSDVLNLTPDNPHATIIGDLTCGTEIPSAAFDCIIFTQALQFMYDAAAAIRTLHRSLKRGGVLLMTVPGISQICRWDMDRWGDYWRFTSASTTRLLGDVFGTEHLVVQAHGNVLATVGFLQGLADQELMPAELDMVDPDYQLVITARAVK